MLRKLPGFTRFFVVIVALSLAPFAAAQAADLRMDWSDTQPASYTLEETMEQSVSGGGVQSEIFWKRTIPFSDRVISRTENTVRVERHFTGLAIEVTRDAEPPIRYDSTAPVPEAAQSLLIAPFLGLIDAKIAFTVVTAGPDAGRVRDVVGAAETLDALLGPLSQGPLASGLDGFARDGTRRASLARQLEQALRIIPGRLQTQGSSWPVEIDHTSPLAGTLSSDLTATYTRTIPRTGHAQIEVTGRLSQASSDATSPLSGILGITLESGKISGTIAFDTEAGRIAESSMKLETSWSIGAGLLAGEEPMTQTIRQTAHLVHQED
jgi:hypothetical protein